MTEEFAGCRLGRVWRPGIGPAVVTLRGGDVIDITTKAAPTTRDVLELPDPATHVAMAKGDMICALPALLAASHADAGPDDLRLLAPCDLQAVKAVGVTFSKSMIERVIE